jgi:hypothetical protein
MIKELEKEFIGTSETKDFKFIQNAFSEHGFLYEVWVEGKLSHYEVFTKKLVPICIDFERHIYSETEFKETYPKSKDFGVWAWTYSQYKDALKQFNRLDQYGTRNKD